MPVHHQVTHLIAVGLTGGRAVETRGQDAFIQHQHATNESPVTGAALGYSIGDLHEIGVPFWAHGETSKQDFERW
jgi:hypothetical protein